MKEITDEQIREAAEAYIKPFRHTLHLGAEDGVIADFIQGVKWMQEQVPQWIPVSDILPEKGASALVYATGGRQVTAIFHPSFGKECFYAYDLFSEQLSRVEEPTHWQPLPEPPAS